MAKQGRVTVALNETQLATYRKLSSMADVDRKVTIGAAEDAFKRMVLNALLTRKVIHVFRNKYYRLTPNMDVTLFQRNHRPTSKAGLAFAAKQGAGRTALASQRGTAASDAHRGRKSAKQERPQAL